MKKAGIISIVMGLLAIAAPMVAGLSIAVMVGLVVLVAGIARMVWALNAKTFGKSALGLGIGGLTLACGIALVTDPLLASGFLTIILAVYFLIDGVVEIAAAFYARPVRGWGWLLAGGVLSFALGLMIWRQYPLSGAWATGVLLGFKLLFSGLIMLSIGSIEKSAEASTATPSA